MVAGARAMFWANYRRGPSLSVPAPFDDNSSDFWWYDRVSQMMAHLASVGYTDMLLPNPIKTISGAYRTGDGYGPFDDYDIGSKAAMGRFPTRFGTAEQLRRCIAIGRANGIALHIDDVMHQRMGGRAGVYRYLGADGKTLNGRFPKDPGCFRDTGQGPPRVPEDDVPAPADDYPFGDQLCPQKGQPERYVWDGLIDASIWLFRTLGIQGARTDDMKGMHAPFMVDFAKRLAAGLGFRPFLFGEYASGNPNDLKWWIDLVQGLYSAIDFDFHYNFAQNMCNSGGKFWMGSLNRPSLVKADPMHAVTWVESMDSDTNGFAGIIWNKILGYCLMMGFEGLPMTYARDYLSEPECYGLHDRIDNLTWCHQKLASGPTVFRGASEQNVAFFERLGPPGLLMALNNNVWSGGWETRSIQTAFGPNVELKDYTGGNTGHVWTDERGYATIGIPPAIDGRGYGMWSRVGHDGPVSPAGTWTQQTFFGAPDLDIMPAAGGRERLVAKIWCDEGTPLTARLHLGGHIEGRPSMLVYGPGQTAAADMPWESGTEIRTEERGWHTLTVELPAGQPDTAYECTVRYRAPRTITTEELAA